MCSTNHDASMIIRRFFLMRNTEGNWIINGTEQREDNTAVPTETSRTNATKRSFGLSSGISRSRVKQNCDIGRIKLPQSKDEKGSFTSDMRDLLESGEGADVTLVTGGSQLRAHSQILAARSPVFAAMFQHNMQEARSRHVEVPDVREQVLKELLSFIYCDATPQLESLAAELLTASDKYDLPLLKKRCEENTARKITVNNAASYAALAVQHSCPQLKSAVVKFIRGNNQVMGTDGWEQLLLNHAEIAVDICKQVTETSQNNRYAQPYGRSEPYYYD